MVPRVLAAAALIAALCSIAPMPWWPLWQLRFAAMESRLLVLTLALVGAALARGDRGALGAGLLAAVILAPPVARQAILALARDLPISWAAAAVGEVAPEVPVRRDVALDPSRPWLVVDVLGAGPRWVLNVHGGSWSGGDKGEWTWLLAELASRGFTVVDLRYRLVPDHLFPAAAEDVACAFQAVRERAAELGVDPDRGAMLGRSAGGHLVQLAAHAGDAVAPGCPGPRPRAVASLYAPIDLAWGYHHPFVPDVIGGPAALRAFLGGSPEEVPEAYALASPHLHASPASPPTLLLHGQAEALVRPDHAGFMADALRRVGRPVEVVLVPGADHGFDVRPGGIAAQIALGEIARFLEQQLGPG